MKYFLNYLLIPDAFENPSFGFMVLLLFLQGVNHIEHRIHISYFPFLLYTVLIRDDLYNFQVGNGLYCFLFP